jgi:hypothetical protein
VPHAVEDFRRAHADHEFVRARQPFRLVAPIGGSEQRAAHVEVFEELHALQHGLQHDALHRAADQRGDGADVEQLP